VCFREGLRSENSGLFGRVWSERAFRLVGRSVGQTGAMIDDFAATLRAAQAGDEHAVGVLWHELNHRLVRFLRSRDRDAAEDIASETWLTVASKVSQFSGGEVEFRAWLFTIARSRLIDWQRRQMRRPLTCSDGERFPEVVASDDPAAEALAGLDSAASFAMIAKLPDDQAEVILLRVLAGLDVARVSQIVGKRPGTVRMLQLRGLRRLEGMLSSVDAKNQGVTR
jgi:RNA polymerase sigma-70 factor (ECF subfamily)